MSELLSELLSDYSPHLFYILLPRILSTAVSGGCVLLFVFALRLCFKKAPAWARLLLWLPAAIRLVSLQVPSWRFSPVLLNQQAFVLPGQMQLGIPALDQFAQASYQAGASPLVQQAKLLAVVWLAGFVVMLAGGALQQLRLAARLRFAVRVAPGIYESEALDTAFILGLIRPRIFMPSGLNEAQRRLLLIHEWCHIRRGDLLWRLLGWCLRAVFWFHPLVWVAFYLLEQDLEAACDQAVLREGVSASDYSSALLAVSAKQNGLRLPLAFGEGETSRRIKEALFYKQPSQWVALVCAALCACFFVGFSTNQPNRSPFPQAEQTAQKFLQVFFTAQPDPSIADAKAYPRHLKSQLEQAGIIAYLGDGQFYEATPQWYANEQKVSIEPLRVALEYQPRASSSPLSPTPVYQFSYTLWATETQASGGKSLRSTTATVKLIQPVPGQFRILSFEWFRGWGS